MTDLRVVATIPAKSGSEEVVRDALTTLAEETRKEEGCVEYLLFESQAAPGVFVTVETWRAQADLDAHLASPHLATAFAVATEAIEGEVAIHPLTPVV